MTSLGFQFIAKCPKKCSNNSAEEPTDLGGKLVNHVNAHPRRVDGKDLHRIELGILYKLIADLFK
jgi:hypothetical protein